jgi:hypothetical protein
MLAYPGVLIPTHSQALEGVESQEILGTVQVALAALIDPVDVL